LNDHKDREKRRNIQSNYNTKTQIRYKRNTGKTLCKAIFEQLRRHREKQTYRRFMTKKYRIRQRKAYVEKRKNTL
jgi:hypothetical protein